jgi:hypothetical protein
LEEDISQRSISSIGGDNLLKFFVILVEMIKFYYLNPYLGVELVDDKENDPYTNTDQQNPFPFCLERRSHKSGSFNHGQFLCFHNIKKTWSKDNIKKAILKMAFIAEVYDPFLSA